MNTHTEHKRKNKPFERLLSLVVSVSMVLSLIPTQAVAEMQTEISGTIGSQSEVDYASGSLSDQQLTTTETAPPTDTGQQNTAATEKGNLKVLLSLDGAPQGSESRDFTVVVKNAKNEYLSNTGKWVMIQDKGQEKAKGTAEAVGQSETEKTGKVGDDSTAGDDEDGEADSARNAEDVAVADAKPIEKANEQTDAKTKDEQEKITFADEFKLQVSVADALQLNGVPTGTYTVLELEDDRAIEGYTFNEASSTIKVENVEVKSEQTAEAKLHNVYAKAGEQAPKPEEAKKAEEAKTGDAESANKGTQEEAAKAEAAKAEAAKADEQKNEVAKSDEAKTGEQNVDAPAPEASPAEPLSLPKLPHQVSLATQRIPSSMRMTP